MVLIFSLMAILIGLPFLMRDIKKQRRERLIRRQLRQCLQAMCHSLRVGCSFLQALERGGRGIEEPLAKELKKVIYAVQTGASQRDALNELSRALPLKEIRWFVTAARICQETGGSLSTVLDTLAVTLQERETLYEKVSALTAQGKASGILLGLLPFSMLAALYVISPEFVRPLFVTASGQLMLAGIIVLVTLGGLVIRNIVSISTDS